MARSWLNFAENPVTKTRLEVLSMLQNRQVPEWVNQKIIQNIPTIDYGAAIQALKFVSCYDLFFQKIANEWDTIEDDIEFFSFLKFFIRILVRKQQSAILIEFLTFHDVWIVRNVIEGILKVGICNTKRFVYLLFVIYNSCEEEMHCYVINGLMAALNRPDIFEALSIVSGKTKPEIEIVILKKNKKVLRDFLSSFKKEKNWQFYQNVNNNFQYQITTAQNGRRRRV